MVLLYSHHDRRWGIILGSELFLLVLLPASLFDILRYKVPNALIVSALLISLIRRLEVQGLTGIYPWLTGIIIPFILCYIFYRCRMLGASDSKMFSVVGSFVGIRLLLDIMVVSLLIGAVMAVSKMILRKNFIRRFRRLSNYVICCMQEKKMKPYYDRDCEGEDGIIPFTVAISLAVLICAY